MPVTITRSTLGRFLKKALAELKGDWVVLGGNVLPLLGSETRPTSDIDFVPLQETDSASQLKVMEICESLGLPPEAANPAAALFLKRIPGHEKQLLLVDSSKKVRIYRPNAALFLKLKIGRFSESDLSDCLEILQLEGQTLTATDRKAIQASLKKMLTSAGADKRKRIEDLLSRL